MKALINENGKLALGQAAAPQDCKDGELKVSVVCASLNPTDAEIAEGKFDWLLRLMGVRDKVRTGLEFAGTVKEAGAGYDQGARVFGNVHLIKGPKTHQQEICVSADMLAPLPDSVTFEQAAGVAIGIQTSMVALEDLAGLKPGDAVLINGAGGGVGLYAVQVAKNMGLKVTAIGSTGQEDLLRSLGAYEAYDYHHTPLSALTQKFDSVLELSTLLKFKDVRRLLKPRGSFIPFNPLNNLADFAGNLLRRQKAKYLMVDRGDHKRLAEAAQMLGDGRIQVVQGPVFPLEDHAKALHLMEQRGYASRIVLRLQPGT